MAPGVNLNALQTLPNSKMLKLYQEQSVPVTVVTGFLASGKSTLIRERLRDADKGDIEGRCGTSQR